MREEKQEEAQCHAREPTRHAIGSASSLSETLE